MSKTLFEWAQPRPPYRIDFSDRKSVSENDVFLITMPVKAIARWNNRIPDDFDDEGNPVSYRKGYEVHVFPDQVNSNPDRFEKNYLFNCMPEAPSTEDADVYFVNRMGSHLQISVEGPLANRLDKIYDRIPKRGGYSRMTAKDKEFFEQNKVSLLDTSRNEYEDQEKVVTTDKEFAESVDSCVERFLKEMGDILEKHLE